MRRPSIQKSCWRKSADLLSIKFGLSLLLLVPIAGPLAYSWIHAFPELPPAELRDGAHGPMAAQTFLFYKYRKALEATERLAPLVQLFRRRRKK